MPDPLQPCVHLKCPLNAIGGMMGAVSHSEELKQQKRHRVLIRWLVGVTIGESLAVVLLLWILTNA